MSASSIHTTAASQRTLSKNNIRKKSLRNIVKQQVSRSRYDEADDDTLEFTQLENIKNINGLPRVR